LSVFWRADLLAKKTDKLEKTVANTKDISDK